MMENDIVIAGGGIAGLSAAIYGARAGRRTLLLEGRQPGGQIINSLEVDNYPGSPHISGFELIQRLREQVKDAGAKLSGGVVTGIRQQDGNKVVQTDTGDVLCHTVVLATGVTRRELGLPMEKELTGSGVSYCAVCDGAFYRGKEVAVVGGGNTALEDALYLSKHCRMVWLIHRRDRFRGENRLVEAVRSTSNINCIMESSVIALHGEGQLQAIDIKNEKTKAIEEKQVDGVFVAIGQIPQNEPFSSLVQLDESGYIRADEDCNTSCPGVFAAGDCRTKKLRQLVTAAADGAVAALEACEFLELKTIHA